LTVRAFLILTGCLWLGVLATSPEASAVELWRAGGSAVPGFVSPGQWAEVSFSVANDQATDQTVEHVVRFSGGDEVQFVTRFWVPAGARRDGLQPVRCPALPRNLDAADVSSMDIEVTLLDGQGQVKGRDAGLMRFEPEPDATVLVTGGNTPDAATRWVTRTRIASGGTRRLAYLRSDTIPERGLGLDAAREIVIADPEINLSAGQLDTLRDWVIDGGTLWLMLDRLPEAFPSALLGSAWTVTQMGRNQINEASVQFQDGRSTRSFEYPIELVWVDPGNFKVIATVDGDYPALLAQDLGMGRVVATTLNAEAWMDAQDDLLPVGAAVADVLMHEGEKPAFDEGVLNRVASGQVGYEILSRGWVLVGLGVYLLVLLGAGLWFARQQRLDRLAVIAVVAAGAVTLIFAVVGITTRSAVPATVAGTPVLTVEPALNRAVMSGRLSLYTPSAVQGSISAQGGALLWPQSPGSLDVDPRMVWTDLDAYRWDNLTLPPGAVRNVTVWQGRPHEASAARMSFADGGVELVAPGGLNDAVVATPAGGLTPRAESPVDDAGMQRWHAEAQDTARNGRYIRAGTLSIEQQRRLWLYRSLYEGFPRRQTVLTGWAESVPLGVELPFEAARRYETLMLMPLALRRPEAGATVTIPAPLLPYRAVSRQGISSSTVYDNHQRQWLGQVTTGTTVLLALRPPHSLLPLELNEVSVALDIDARGRTVELGTARGGRFVAVKTLQSPTGLNRVTLSGRGDPGLRVEPDGSVLLAIRVGNGEGTQALTPWRMNSLGASLSATVLEGADR